MICVRQEFNMISLQKKTKQNQNKVMTIKHTKI